MPVVGHILQIETLGDVDEIEQILLETAAAEADGGLQKLGSDARVHADGARHLTHVGAGGLADGRHGIDAGDALGEESVGRLQQNATKKNKKKK